MNEDENKALAELASAYAKEYRKVKAGLGSTTTRAAELDAAMKASGRFALGECELTPLILPRPPIQRPHTAKCEILYVLVDPALGLRADDMRSIVESVQRGGINITVGSDAASIARVCTDESAVLLITGAHSSRAWADAAKNEIFWRGGCGKIMQVLV